MDDTMDKTEAWDGPSYHEAIGYKRGLLKAAELAEEWADGDDAYIMNLFAYRLRALAAEKG